MIFFHFKNANASTNVSTKREKIFDPCVCVSSCVVEGEHGWGSS